jgi:hypothetical protein
MEEVGSGSAFLEVSRQIPATTNGQAHLRKLKAEGGGMTLQSKDEG